MEKERRIKALSIVALLITIVGLTVAFAAMSRLLTINGTASVGKFDVHFATNSEFHGQGQIYDFTGTDGVSDATIEAGQEGTAEIVDGITVNNLKAQFDRTGNDSKATFKLYIVNDSNRIAYVNSITYGSDCNQTNSIMCSLKDLNGDEISTQTSIAAHGNMFVFLEVVAPDSVGSNTTDNDYDMQVQVTFSQDQVSEQSSGNDPISVDDSDVYYNISFKSFSSFNLSDYNNTFGTDEKEEYAMYLRGLNSNYFILSIWYTECKSGDNYMMSLMEFDASSPIVSQSQITKISVYAFDDTIEDIIAGEWNDSKEGYSDGDFEALNHLNNVQIISASEFEEGTGLNPSDEGYSDLLKTDAQLFLNITPAS